MSIGQPQPQIGMAVLPPHMYKQREHVVEETGGGWAACAPPLPQSNCLR